MIRRICDGLKETRNCVIYIVASSGKSFSDITHRITSTSNASTHAPLGWHCACARIIFRETSCRARSLSNFHGERKSQRCVFVCVCVSAPRVTKHHKHRALRRGACGSGTQSQSQSTRGGHLRQPQLHVIITHNRSGCSSQRRNQRPTCANIPFVRCE